MLEPWLSLPESSRLIDDLAAFIRTNTRLSPVPLTPQIQIYGADEATALWQKTEDELERGYGPPPFWAFAWAGGQALARYILDHPQLVKDKYVLDFASGSGLVAIAAALAGAREVEANDIDPFAGEAVRLNAIENGVPVKTRIVNLIGADEPWDIIFAGDISYERDTAAGVATWLEARAKAGTLVFIGDPGRAYLPREKLRSLASYDVPVTLALEDVAIKRTDVWCFV